MEEKKIDLSKHFQNTDIVKFTISDGSEFAYRPMTAGEENDYMHEYLEEVETINPETGDKIRVRKENPSKINKVKSYNLVGAPYENWDKMSQEERWQLMKKLKKGIFSEIIRAINKIDQGDTNSKKNSSKA